MKDVQVGRPIQTEGMAYAPTNHEGVVYLFGRLAPRLGFHVESVGAQFPDCVARRRGKACLIEFEYRASQYVNHPPRGANVIVCWENDWEYRPPKYRHLEIIDLKSHVGASPHVFAVGCNDLDRGDALDRYNKIDWNVLRSTQVGDLIVMYRTTPVRGIRDLWRVVGPFFEDPVWGYEAYMRVVARLTKPLTFDDLKNDPSTGSLGIVRKRFRGRSDITDDWPQIRAKMLALNPRAKAALHEHHFL